MLVVVWSVAVAKRCAATRRIQQSALYSNPASASMTWLVLQRIVEASHGVPAVRQWPLRGEVDLVDVSRAVTVVRADHRRASWLPSCPGGRPDQLAAFGGVLRGEVDGPRLPSSAVTPREQVGRVARARRFAGQRHALRTEVVALADGRAQSFGAGFVVEYAGGERERELVGLGDAVVARVDVLGEQLRVVQFDQRAVEVRQVVLVAVRDVRVEEPRLQRLLRPAPEPRDAAVRRSGPSRS